MRGAIAGDVVGSRFEFDPVRGDEFDWFVLGKCFFTDDSVLTVAVAEALLLSRDMGESIYEWANHYPDMSWGERFRDWMGDAQPEPYNSLGNGSAMRVSACAWLARSEEEALEFAKQSAMPTHNHPQGVIGAQAVALAIWLARQGETSASIRKRVADFSGYDLSKSYAETQPLARYDETCPVSVPEAIIAALDAESFEEAVRNAVLLRADADTQAAIAGAIAEARFEGVPSKLWQPIVRCLDAPLLNVFAAFDAKLAQL